MCYDGFERSCVVRNSSRGRLGLRRKECLILEICMCCVEIQRAADLVKVPRRFGEGLSLWPTPSPLIRPYNDVERYFCGEGPRIFYRPSPKKQSCESLPAGYRGKRPTLRDFACRVPWKMAYPAGRAFRLFLPEPMKKRLERKTFTVSYIMLRLYPILRTVK